ncbi:unnamed protein product [Adineta ricciae]|uniref:Uncharacterized protein n=1 Tax=Adineta ricciae TaxID=249248 RepID=A0A814TCB5_ADIRI|nr:unnamed protein product [Adineta ricciae]CAF1261597.1 unnamed protein product [Adineta ricciae]
MKISVFTTLRMLGDQTKHVVGVRNKSFHFSLNNIILDNEQQNSVEVFFLFLFKSCQFALSFQFTFGENTFFHFTTHRINLEERMGNCCSGLGKDDKNGPPPPDRQSGPPPPQRGRDDDNRRGDHRGDGPGSEGKQKK